MNLVLASGSPRRALLLDAAGIPFTVQIPGVDETRREGEAPAEYVLRLSEEKARSVTAAQNRGVLGADTVVVLAGEPIGKPSSLEEAVSILERLAGRTHEVLTGWTLIGPLAERFGVEETFVTFTDRSTDELRDHVARAQPLDKAGAYALQEDDGWLVAQVRGSRANVMGLPLRPVIDALDDFGIERSAD